MYACMYVCVCVCVYICMYVCVYVCVCVCMIYRIQEDLVSSVPSVNTRKPLAVWHAATARYTPPRLQEATPPGFAVAVVVVLVGGG